MKNINLLENLAYNDSKPAISVLFETDFSKEIRILFKTGQKMNKHQTKFPITVEMVVGELDFGVNGEVLALTRVDLIALEGGVPHDLQAKTDCIVRLALSKLDDVNSVEKVVNA
jgi:quercetin dioxygenase-like cupin family protein